MSNPIACAALKIPIRPSPRLVVDPASDHIDSRPLPNETMSRWLFTTFAVSILAALCILTAGCGSKGKSPTKTPITPLPTAPVATQTPVHSTPIPIRTHPPITASYRAFVKSLCGAFASRDVTTIISDFASYKYNFGGLYYGTFNGLEGQFASSTLVTQWVSSGSVHCTKLAYPDRGHAALTTRGWSGIGPWGIFDLDKFLGQWRIDDVDMGTRGEVMGAFRGNFATHFRYSQLH